RRSSASRPGPYPGLAGDRTLPRRRCRRRGQHPGDGACDGCCAAAVQCGPPRVARPAGRTAAIRTRPGRRRRPARAGILRRPGPDALAGTLDLHRLGLARGRRGRRLPGPVGRATARTGRARRHRASLVGGMVGPARPLRRCRDRDAGQSRDRGAAGAGSRFPGLAGRCPAGAGAGRRPVDRTLRLSRPGLRMLRQGRDGRGAVRPRPPDDPCWSTSMTMSTRRPLCAVVVLSLSVLVAAGAAHAGVVCDTTTAATVPSTAAGTDALACGEGNVASGDSSTAIRHDNIASGLRSITAGADNEATGERANAFGTGNVASGSFSAALGSNNFATGDFGVGVGYVSNALGQNAISVGSFSVAEVDSSIAIGAYSRASGNSALASAGSIAIGGWLDMDGDGALAAPISDTNGDGVIDALDASGEQTWAGGNIAMAIGSAAWARRDFTIALGAQAHAGGTGALALGYNAYALGDTSISLGYSAVSQGLQSIAIGHNASAPAAGAVAIGAGSYALRPDTVAVGSTGAERQVVHVANGTEATDAVNLGQLQATLTSANAYTDAQIAGIAPGTGGLSEAQVQAIADTGDGTTLTAANAYTDAAIISAGAVTLTMVEAGDAATLTSARTYADAGDATLRTEIEAGDEATLDAARDYADTGDASTLTAANSYTDTQIAALTGFDPGSINGRLDAFDDRFEDIDRRMHRQDQRIDRQGAMGAAMLNMAINAAGSQSPRGRIAVGAGFQGGERALSVGYGKRIGNRASFSLGGAFSGSERSAGVGFGVDL